MTRALLRLRELILRGEFAPGERMSELRLVETLGVSRTPLRLALAALEHEGLLRSRGLARIRGAGVHAVRHQRRDRAPRRARRHRGPVRRRARSRVRGHRRNCAAICDTIEQMVHRADYESFERFVDLNERFHAGILRMAGSPMLERALDGIIALPFASPSAFVMAQAVLPRIARHPALGSPPPPRSARRDRAQPGHPRRKPRPRARAARADQPRGRARSSRCARADARRLAARPTRARTSP